MGVMFSFAHLVREIPALEPALRRLVAGGKVVTGGCVLLQRPGRAMLNLKGDIVTSGNQGGAWVYVKHSTATQRAATAEHVARTPEEEVARLRPENSESSRAFEDGGEVRRELEVSRDRVEFFNYQS